MQYESRASDEAFLELLMEAGYFPLSPTVGTAPGLGLFLRITDDPGAGWYDHGATGMVEEGPATGRWAPPKPIDATRASFEAGQIAPSEPGHRKQSQPTQILDEGLRACFPKTGPIAAYMEWAHRVTHTPPQFHLAAILPPMATECNRRGWEIDPREPLHVWSAIVAGSALGKTTAMTMAEDFSRAWAKHSRGVEFSETWVSLEGSLPGVVHALGEKFDERSGKTIATLQHSELSRVLRSDDALELLCMLFDTRDVDRNLRYYQKRKDKGDSSDDENEGKIRAPRVSALVTTTGASLEDTFRTVMMRGGLASRMLWFTGSITAEQLMPRERVEPELYQEAQRAWWDWSGYLAGLDSQFAAEKRRRTISVTDAADDHLTEFYDSLRSKIVDQNDPLASVFQRSTRMVLRIAGIYALSLGRTEIDLLDLIPAMALVSQSLEHLGVLAPSMTENRLERHRGKLLAAIRKAGVEGLPKSKTFPVVQGLSAFEIKNVLEDLEQMEAILELSLTLERTGQRGRPTQFIVANTAANRKAWLAKHPRAQN